MPPGQSGLVNVVHHVIHAPLRLLGAIGGRQRGDKGFQDEPHFGEAEGAGRNAAVFRREADGGTDEVVAAMAISISLTTTSGVVRIS